MSLYFQPPSTLSFRHVPITVFIDAYGRPRLSCIAMMLVASLLLLVRDAVSESLRETASLAGGWHVLAEYRAPNHPRAEWLKTIPTQAARVSWPGPMSLHAGDHPGSVTLYLWRPVEAPRRWRGKAVWLQIPDVEGPTQVFLNGRMINRGEIGAGAGAELGVSAVLLPGESNLLLLQILGATEGRRMVRGDPPALVVASPLHLSQLVVRPEPEEGIFHVNAGLRQLPGLATAQTSLDADADRYDVEFLVKDGPPEKPGSASPESAVRSVRIHDQQMNVSAPLPVGNPRHWTPDSPVLYTIQATLRRNDKVVDQLICSAGFAQGSIKEGRFHRNGQWTDLFAFGIPAAMVRWVEDGAWAEVRSPKAESSAAALPQTAGFVHTRRVAFWRNALSALKAMGFNLVRFDDRAPSSILDAADRVGIYVEQRVAPRTRDEAPNAGLAGAYVIAEAVRRDQTHPSLAFWRVESAGSAGQMNALANALRILDPARPAFAFLQNDTRIRRPGIVYVAGEGDPLAILETAEIPLNTTSLRTWELLSVSMDPAHPFPVTPSWTWIPLLGELRPETVGMMAQRIRIARSNPQSAGCGLALALPEWGRSGMPPAQRIPQLPEFLWPFQDRATSSTIASALSDAHILVNPTLDSLTIGTAAQVDVAIVLARRQAVPDRGTLRLHLRPASERATAFPPMKVERTLALADFLDTTRVARIGVEINLTPEIPPGPALLEAEWDDGEAVQKSQPHPVVIIKRK